MNPIACFYHSRISGGAHPPNQFFAGNPDLEREFACSVVAEQVTEMWKSDLIVACSQLIFGLNGTLDDYKFMKTMCGPATVVLHPEGSSSELPTMALIQDWARNHPGWFVLYLHTKGVLWPPARPGAEGRKAWRRCMMKHCVTNWSTCISDLSTGLDMVGAHWITPEGFPQFAHALPVGSGIWGGNFWWATSNYLVTLPELTSLEPGMDLSWRYRYQAEHWPTTGKPRVKDYAPHWPDLATCGK